MNIEILGPGCRRCRTLEERTRDALAALGLEADVESVSDPARIAGRGVMRTPGLVVDGEVIVTGHVPTVRELTKQLASRARPASPHHVP